jgi:hypothetical protein
MSPSNRRRAFTRTELLASCAALSLIATLVLPALAATRSDSGRMVCFNNLRLIGRGVAMWTADHNQRFSWRTRVEDGGTVQNGSRPGAAWYEFLILSNEFVTATILACPSDVGVWRARSFESSNDAGLANVSYRNNAVSYPLHLDGSPDVPRSWLSGDRNLNGSFGGSGCSAGVANVSVLWPDNLSLRWTNAVHGPDFGHILTTDGAVEFTGHSRLREIILGQGIDDNGQTHFLKAR